MGIWQAVLKIRQQFCAQAVRQRSCEAMPDSPISRGDARPRRSFRRSCVEPHPEQAQNTPVHGAARHRFHEFGGTVALTSWGAVWLEPRRSSGDVEDVEERVDEAYLVGDVRFTGEAMTSTDHSHDLRALDRGSCGPHRLKAAGGTDDVFQCPMVGFNDVG
jgi:hypothetical protein